MGSDDDPVAMVQITLQKVQQRPTSRAERQVAGVIKDNEAKAGQAFRNMPRFALSFLLFEGIHQLDGGEEPHLATVMLDSLDS